MKFILIWLQLLYLINGFTIEEYETASNSSLLWGPYRSNLYLGIRPRIPNSLMTGLFWFNTEDFNHLINSKHSCDQNDDFEKFSWTKFDSRIGGVEEIKDNENHLDLTFSFVKSYNLRNINDHSWGLKINAKPHEGFEKIKTSMIFYVGLEINDPINGEHLTITNIKKEVGYEKGENIVLEGYSKDLKTFKIEINDGPNTNQHIKSHKNLIPDDRWDPQFTKHVELNVPENNIWKAKPIFVTLVQDSLKYLNEKFQNNQLNFQMDQLAPWVGMILPDLNMYKGNLHYIQKSFVGEFEFDIVYQSGNENKPLSRGQGYEEITFKSLDSKIKLAKEKFDSKFSEVFKFNSPFNSEKYVKFGQDFISNLIGGIGYFYGDHLVDRTTEIDEEGDDDEGKFKKLVGKPEGPFELFTSVPSRPFFPRGFYWDEGFHLLPILEFDFDLSLEILKSWFNLIDDDGWIAREQILGEESRSKVPPEFQVQNPNIANPPTLMLTFLEVLKKAKIAEQLKEDLESPEDVEEFGSFDDCNEINIDNLDKFHLNHPELLIDYAKTIYPKLQKHYDWFRRTQKGELEEFDRAPFSLNEGYRWIGRTEKLCLPSGLDDYPRAEVPDIGELHVDLISWIGSFTNSMKQFAELLGYEDDFKKYSQVELEIVKNIEDLHWSKDDKVYCDVTLDFSDNDVFVCHKGYISLFPFLLKLIPKDSTNLNHLISLIADPNELFSNFGIRSLSKQDDSFRKGEDYWRGKIWININYLILDSLIYYVDGLDDGIKPVAQKLYKDLRLNLVNNVFEQFEKTGYGWENYDESDGNPTGVRHFLGWTSLVVLIMKMPENI